MKPSTKFAISTAVAGLISTGAFAADTKKMETKKPAPAMAEVGKCDGLIATAKKDNACSTATNGCAGQAKVGDKIWKKLSKQECAAAKGVWSPMPADAHHM